MRTALLLVLLTGLFGWTGCGSCNPAATAAPNPCDTPNPNPCGAPNPNPCGNSRGYGVTPTIPSYQEGGHGWR